MSRRPSQVPIKSKTWKFTAESSSTLKYSIDFPDYGKQPRGVFVMTEGYWGMNRKNVLVFTMEISYVKSRTK